MAWNDFFQHPEEREPLSAGSYGIWELTLHNDFIVFKIGSKRLFPNGLECTWDQLKESLDILTKFIEEITMSSHLYLMQKRTSDFNINVIGALPQVSVPFPVSIDRLLPLIVRIKKKGIFLFENMFGVVGAIVKRFGWQQVGFLDDSYTEVSISTISKVSKAVLFLMIILSGDWIVIDLGIDLSVFVDALDDDEKVDLHPYLVENRHSDEFQAVEYIKQ